MRSAPSTLSHQGFDRDGFAIVEAVLGFEAVDELIVAIERRQASSAAGSAANLRNILATIPEVAQLCSMPAVLALAEEVLGRGAFVVRGLLFDKTSAANWKVAWHQDITIAVRDQRDAAGFGPWSIKAGIPHVQPPASVLERMVTLRIHLDDCDMSNGALKVLPGSHRMGRLAADQIDEMRSHQSPINCAVRRGGVLLMRPLLLHASAPAENPTHRRVIHLEFATDDLPHGLTWFGRS